MPQIKGKLIVIEGGDGSGKATQTQLLVKGLSKKHKVTFFEFPRYKQSQFGKLIRRSLTGEFGDFLNLSPYLSSLPHMLDRVRAKNLMLEALKEGDIVCDRYTPSNLAHQSAKLHKKERAAFISFIEETEYGELGMPTPDIVIYLWVPADISRKLMLKRAKREKSKLDSYEDRTEYQSKVIDMYLKLAKQRSNWFVVKCVDSRGKLLSKNTIHKMVFQIVAKRLKIKQ
ncbi:MAG: hypothetical protein AAB690_01770 [Patescibacteria group bacterium]